MEFPIRNVLPTILALCGSLPTAARAQPCERPAIPTGLISTPSDCSATLSWGPVANATRYVVYRAYQQEPYGTTTEPWLFLPDLLHRQESFYVYAENACGRSDWAAFVSVTPTYGRSPRFTRFWASENLCDRISLGIWMEASLINGQYVRLWRSPTPNLQDATVLRDLFPGGPWNLDDTTPLPGADVWYWAESASVHCGSSFSPPAHGRVLPLSQPPNALLATNGTLCDGVFLTWSHGGCPARYRVLRGSSPEIGTAAVISPPEGLATGEFIDTTARPGVTNGYWILPYSGPWVGPPGGPVPGARMESGHVTISRSPDWFFPTWRGGDELTAVMTFDFWGALSYQFQWRKNGIPLVDGDRVTGSTQQYLEIYPMHDEDLGFYDVVVTTACGTTTSPSLPLRWDGPPSCPPCLADYNQDGGVDGTDVGAFFADWESGAPCADTNHDGSVDGQDVEPFYDSWEFTSCG